MPLKTLFGPVSGAFASHHLLALRRQGLCLSFGPEPGVDVVVPDSTTSWDEVVRQLPSGWYPDLVALYLPYTALPPAVWSAPVPVMGLAADWNWLFHRQRRLPCDLFLSDQAGVTALKQAGYRRVWQACLYGLPEDFAADDRAEGERPIDILFVGNFHAPIQGPRLPWMGRLAALADRYRVVLSTGVFGQAYRDLLYQAKIVFNRSARGECNRRAFEAAACGALLFQERENREIGDFFTDGVDCVLYDDATLEDLLAHYLGHDSLRQRLAVAGRAQARSCTFEALWSRSLESLEAHLPELHSLAQQRAVEPALPGLMERTWEALERPPFDIEPLLRELAEAATRGEVQAAVAGGLIAGLSPHGQALSVEAYETALQSDPLHAVARLSLVEVLLAQGRHEEASSQAHKALEMLHRHDISNLRSLELPPYPPGFHAVRVAWERAAWASQGNPEAEAQAKVAILRGRLQALLAELTGDLPWAYEAALSSPEPSRARASLGCALARANRLGEAAGHLEAALKDNPFDPQAARALAQVYSDQGRIVARRHLESARRRLAQAAPGLVPPEPWFAGSGTLVSIVIPCHNQEEFTRPCLESVLRHTRPPYELIVVDNASTDGTAALVQELMQVPGPSRVAGVANATNVGFPAACNQGLRHARGTVVVFLNNDTLVTPGWLDGLLRLALAPTVGLVGPMTNASRPPQEIVVSEEQLAHLDDFAEQFRRRHAGKVLEVERLTGFCLAGRRALLEELGGFDEGFGLGFFDDDDLSVRMRRQGYRLLVAQEVFIRHFGSRTFRALGIDCPRQLQDNFERFHQKWGPAETSGYHLPKEKALPRPRVSLCLIVRNEEANLPECLASAADLVDEVVVVDTGSTDRTREIAANFGARVAEFPWVDSFAAARNASLRQASGDWVLWLDADDRLDADNRERLRRLCAGLGQEHAAYVFRCRCDPDPHSGTVTVVDHVRLFRRHPEVWWEYRVHEQILPALRRTGADVRWADVEVRHTGYVDAALRRRKLERDLRLLRLEDAERPDEPFVLFNLGSVEQELGHIDTALELFQRSLERSHPKDSITRKLFALITQCRRRRGEGDLALRACQEGRSFYPDDAELLWLEATLHEEAGHYEAAEACLLHLIQGREAEHFGSVATGLRGFRAWHQLGVVYRHLGKWDQAKDAWQRALAEEPHFGPSRAELERWGQGPLRLFARVQLLYYPRFPVVATTLRARPSRGLWKSCSVGEADVPVWAPPFLAAFATAHGSTRPAAEVGQDSADDFTNRSKNSPQRAAGFLRIATKLERGWPVWINRGWFFVGLPISGSRFQNMAPEMTL